MKGDFVSVLVDTGSGTSKQFETTADANGRKIAVNVRSGFVEVHVTGRTGKSVRTDRYRADRVIALQEHVKGDE